MIVYSQLSWECTVNYHDSVQSIVAVFSVYMCCAVVQYYILWYTVHLACSHGPYTVDHHSLQSVQSVHEQSKNHTCNPTGLDEIIHCTECVSALISYINAILYEMTVSIYQSPQRSWWGLVLAKMCAVKWMTWPWPLLYFVSCPWCSVCMWVLCGYYALYCLKLDV